MYTIVIITIQSNVLDCVHFTLFKIDDNNNNNKTVTVVDEVVGTDPVKGETTRYN